jgi:hypothetical protein
LKVLVSNDGIELGMGSIKLFTAIMEQQALKIVNSCLNTNIYSYLETSGGQISNLYLKVVHFFNASDNQTSMTAQDSCFPALMSNTCCSILAAL